MFSTRALFLTWKGWWWGGVVRVSQWRCTIYSYFDSSSNLYLDFTKIFTLLQKPFRALLIYTFKTIISSSTHFHFTLHPHFHGHFHSFKKNYFHFHFHFHFQNILFSVGSAFLYYVNHFKLYSSFCASHSKAQKVLHPSKGAAPGRCLHYFSFMIYHIFCFIICISYIVTHVLHSLFLC